MGRENGFKDAFNGQNYEKLKTRLLREKTLFEDPLFPANENSMNNTYYETERSLRPYGFSWKRPYEIVDNPKLLVEGIIN